MRSLLTCLVLLVSFSCRVPDYGEVTVIYGEEESEHTRLSNPFVTDSNAVAITIGYFFGTAHKANQKVAEANWDWEVLIREAKLGSSGGDSDSATGQGDHEEPPGDPIPKNPPNKKAWWWDDVWIWFKEGSIWIQTLVVTGLIMLGAIAIIFGWRWRNTRGQYDTRTDTHSGDEHGGGI